MLNFYVTEKNAFDERIKKLIILRALFAFLIFGTSLYFHYKEGFYSNFDLSFKIIYLFSVFVLILTFLYVYFLKKFQKKKLFVSIQVLIDTFLITFIVYMTGNFSSIFTFLYPIVIIYSSILLGNRGGLIIASLCCIQYGIMIDLEYYKIIKPLSISGVYLVAEYDWNQVLYKIINTIFFCYAVALLSGFLVKQNLKSKSRLVKLEDQIKNVEKMAAVGEMAAGLAHEIRNPIASLTGSIQILNEELDLYADQKKLMNIILRETDRLNTIVSNFLLYAKPDSGKRNAVNILSVTDDVLFLLKKDNLIATKIFFEININKDLHVIIDEGHFRQIIWNLILNSIEAVDKNGVISIFTEKLKENDLCKLTIKDNGYGIEKDNLKKIFTPFFTTKSKGTGLGLSMVYSILEKYNSKLEVKSEKGEGSSFYFKLQVSEI